METFYTIIEISPNPLTRDTLSIGLLLRDNNKFWLHFSADKKTLARQLLADKAGMVDFVVKQIEEKIAELNAIISKSGTGFFPLTELLGSDRFNYLNVYCNGVLRFSQPSFLTDTVSQDKFEKLFRILIDKTYAKLPAEADPKEAELQATVQNKLIRRVHKKVHTNLELTPEKLPGLFYHFNIDCIGLNGAFVAAKSIAFFRKNDAIVKELSHYLGLISTLNLQYAKRNASNDLFYVIGDEPAAINSREHRTWENLKNNPAVKLINPEESNIVADEIEARKTKTFLEG